MGKRFLVSVLWIWASAAFLQAQVEILEDASAFTANAVNLTFDSRRFGVPAGDLHRAYGVLYSGVAGSRPTIERYAPDVNILPPLFPALFNLPAGESSAGQPLIISFDRPVRRLAFLTVDRRPTLTVFAFTPDGALLGKVDLPPPVAGEGTFAGLETSHPSGIAKAVLDYGDDPAPEAILSLRFDPPDPVVFETVLPQIAESRHPVLPNVSTTLSIFNISSTVAQVRLIFYSADGTPLPAGLPDALTLRRNEALFFEARDFVGDLFQGYARLRSTAPIAADARLRFFRSTGASISEAGVAAVPGRYSQSGAVEWSVPGGTVQPVLQRLDTAVALVNLSGETAAVSLILSNVDATGGIAAFSPVTLGPGRQRTFFLSREFDESPPQMQTVLRIVADQPLAAMLLRTVDGLPVANLSVDAPD